LEQKRPAFVSYARADSLFAHRLAADLKTNGANVWLDQFDIRPGRQWDREVQQALTTCSEVLVILSPASIQSDHVMNEVRYALDEGIPVIPVLYAECHVPFHLRRLQFIDFRADYEVGLKALLSELTGEHQANAAVAAAGAEALHDTEPERIEPSAPAPTGRGLPKYAIAAGLAVALIAGGVFWLQRAQAKPLTDRDVLVLADFTNTTGDTAFDGALRQALAFDLEQSPFLKIIDDEEVNQTLQLMGRPAGQRITNDIAHEVCVREGQKATMGGSIASLGKTYQRASRPRRKTRSTCSRRWRRPPRGCGPNSGSR
jgi:hypothetical protein